MVGEGVLFACLEHPDVKEVLMVNRRPYSASHSKLRECIIPDFMQPEAITAKLSGYDACFYCAGISSRGLNEAVYSQITYDTTLALANHLAFLNPQMVFGHISGSHTDSSEKGKIMWARVKGKAENALMKLPFRKVYNFRPGLMKPTEGQKNVKGYYKIISRLYPFLSAVFSNNSCTLKEVGLAMINSVLKGYPKQILEVEDIRKLAKE